MTSKQFGFTGDLDAEIIRSLLPKHSPTRVFFERDCFCEVVFDTIATLRAFVDDYYEAVIDIDTTVARLSADIIPF